MMRVLIILLIFILNSCGTVPKKEEFQYKPITQELLDHVKKEEKIGEIIYKKDSYAWYASDYLQEKDLLKAEYGLKGWIVDLQAQNPAVIFMSNENNNPKAVITVQPSEFGSIHYFPETTQVRHKEMFKARTIAIEKTKRMCSGNYNTTVLEDEKNWIVYLLVAPYKENTLFAGGNYKLTIDKQSFEIVENQALSKTCFATSYITDSKWPMFTHLVEPTPNAVHAFLSLQNKIDYYVVTDRGLWKISDGKIIFLEK